MIVDLAFVRIKQVIRSKEFYFYVIGFPLFFLILFGFLSKGWAPTVDTISIGYYSIDSPVIDPITDELLNLEEEFLNLLSVHETDAELKTFSIQSYSDLEAMDTDIQDLIVQGGIEIPSDFSLQAGNITRFYASLLITQLLIESFDLYPSEFLGINASLTQLSPYIEGSANLVLRFHGDVTLQTTMQAYTSTWQILSEFLANYTIIHANSIWSELKTTNGLTFDFNITRQSSSDSTLSTNIQLVSAGTGDVVDDFQSEFYSRLLPGQIMQTILMSSISAIWIIDQENKTGLLKRMKLTRLGSVQYLGSVLLAWSIISILQGIFMLAFSAILGFFNFGIPALAYLMMLLTMLLLGLITVTIALIVGSFIEARVATPILVLFASTIHMFVAEYYIDIIPAFTFAGKNFSWFDLIFLRPAFLVMKNGMKLDSASGVTGMLFDLGLLFLWVVIFFTIGAIIFSKFKMRYAEKE
jgi:hypothetical protein